MNTATTGTYGTMYYVKDMAKATAYYSLLGLKPRFSTSDWAEFDLGDGTALCLHLEGTQKPVSQGGILISKVKNIKALVPELKKRGLEFCVELKEVHPGAYSADFKDPFGNVMSLYEDTSAR